MQRREGGVTNQHGGLKEVALQAQQLLTEKQAAEMLSVSATTLATWRCKRRYALPFVRLGSARAIRYRASDIIAFINAGLVDGKDREGDA
jgi:predicted DNA-binding transcriptional regulator AlpA